MLNEKMNAPKVSIIVPVYKAEETLDRCAQSLLNQTLTEIEIILVDDGSPDRSGAMCDDYLTDHRVKVIHKENGGPASARNAGLKIAEGDFIGFVDSDDYVSLEMYEKMYSRIVCDGSDICICSHFTENAGGVTPQHEFDGFPEVLSGDEIWNWLILPLIGQKPDVDQHEIHGFACRNLYRRDKILAHEFRSERVFYAEDVVLNLEIYPLCSRISILNECLYYYWYNGASLTNRYRPGVYRMLNNLLTWELDYLQKNQMDAEIGRVYATGAIFVLIAAINTKRAGELSYFQKRKEIKRIFEQDLLKKSIYAVKLNSHDWKMRGFILLCRLRMVDVLLLLL